MSLAFDEFGRPFIIIKVRARPRRARGEDARARASDDDDDDDGSIHLHPRARDRRRRAKGSWTDGNDARRNKGKSLAFVESRRSARHRGGEERGEDVEVVSGTKGAPG